jgi:hypothetical protein
LIEMGIEPVRLVRLRSEAGAVRFVKMGRALTSVAGVEDLAPVLFGEPGTPTVLGALTLAILLLEADADLKEVRPVPGRG